MKVAALRKPEFDIEEANAETADLSPEELIAWAHKQFGRGLIASTSFGSTSAVMLHMIQQAAPNIPIVCVDTGYLFPETYQFAQHLIQQTHLDVRFYGPTISPARLEALFGRLWEQGKDGVKQYLQMNKVEPMQRALRELQATAWIAGLRADQTEHRSSLRRIDLQDGVIKIHPILSWTERQMEEYLAQHQLPYHPLYAQGYRSIGDAHSTLPTTPDMDPRDGRLLGDSRECGIHLPLTANQAKSLKSSGL